MRFLFLMMIVAAIAGEDLHVVIESARSALLRGDHAQALSILEAAPRSRRLSDATSTSTTPTPGLVVVEPSGTIRVGSGGHLTVGGCHCPSIGASSSSPSPNSPPSPSAPPSPLAPPSPSAPHSPSAPPPPLPVFHMYAFGGGSPLNDQKAYKITDVRSGTWESLPDAPNRWDEASAAYLAGTKRIFVSGKSSKQDDVDRFDLLTQTWAPAGTVASFPHKRRGQVMAALPKSATCCVYVICGMGASGWSQILTDVQKYDDDGSNSWHSAPSLAHSRFSPSAAVLGGKIYVCGGQCVLERPSLPPLTPSRPRRPPTRNLLSLPCMSA